MSFDVKLTESQVLMFDNVAIGRIQKHNLCINENSFFDCGVFFKMVKQSVVMIFVFILSTDKIKVKCFGYILLFSLRAAEQQRIFEQSEIILLHKPPRLLQRQPSGHQTFV